jgi:tetratricopeptide (TPR) repeat protein
MSLRPKKVTVPDSPVQSPPAQPIIINNNIQIPTTGSSSQTTNQPGQLTPPVPDPKEPVRPPADALTLRTSALPIDRQHIHQREAVVKDIYARLIDDGTSAVALCGLGGIGKSTLGALVLSYAEQERRTGRGPFHREALLDQHLVQVQNARGIYRLHPIISTYAHRHFVPNDDESNEQVAQKAHVRAAQYYLQLASTTYPSQDKRHQTSDVLPLIEAVWQYCQAGQYSEAYQLMNEKEHLFEKLSLWGANVMLLELCQLLLAENWQFTPQQKALIFSYIAISSNVLGQKPKALEYYEQALTIRREVGDRGGEGMTLWNIGALFFEQHRHDVALAGYLLAKEIFEQVQSPDIDGVEEWIADLREEVGEQQFAVLLARVEPRAEQIVEETLREVGGEQRECLYL